MDHPRSFRVHSQCGQFSALSLGNTDDSAEQAQRQAIAVLVDGNLQVFGRVPSGKGQSRNPQGLMDPCTHDSGLVAVDTKQVDGLVAYEASEPQPRTDIERTIHGYALLSDPGGLGMAQDLVFPTVFQEGNQQARVRGAIETFEMFDDLLLGTSKEIGGNDMSHLPPAAVRLRAHD